MTYCQRINFFSWIGQWKVNIYQTAYQPPLLVQSRLYWYRAASIGTEPPLLVQRCNGTTARLGLLEVCWVAHAKIPHRAVCLWPHYQAVGYGQSEW
jgi:hypothetical protein